MCTKWVLIFLSLILVTLFAAACSLVEAPAGDAVIGMGNPASVYCQEQGGLLVIQEEPEGQFGVCVLPDGSECEEWAYFRGECDASGEVEPQPLPTKGISLNIPVVAVYGQVVSATGDGPSDSVLVLSPEGFGSVFVIGESAEIDDQITALRDKPEPANKANFWGQLDCPSRDECLLSVSRMRIDGPGALPEPDPVEAWEGVIYSGPPGPHSGGNDYFALLGAMPFEYGIWSADETLNQQLEALRDSGQALRIWGELHPGRMDWNAAQIVVTRIELIDANAAAIPPAPNW